VLSGEHASDKPSKMMAVSPVRCVAAWMGLKVKLLLTASMISTTSGIHAAM
jgi:hypothetical protein